MRNKIGIFGILISSFLLISCGQPAVHKHLTDEIFLTAPDLVEQLSVSYHYSGNSYFSIVNPTVIAVGHNDDFILVKQEPEDRDTVLYYIIDVNKIKTEREKFVSKMDTIKYRSFYTDRNGNDSLGAEQTQISTSRFSPKSAEPMTLQEFKKRREILNIPKELDFTLHYNKRK